jgi:hypothetical protein
MHGFTTSLRFADGNIEIRGMVNDHYQPFLSTSQDSSSPSSLFLHPTFQAEDGARQTRRLQSKPTQSTTTTRLKAQGSSTLTIITTTTTIKHQHQRPHHRLPAQMPTNRRPAALLPASSFLRECRPGCYSSPQSSKAKPNHNHSPPAPDPPGSRSLSLPAPAHG